MLDEKDGNLYLLNGLLLTFLFFTARVICYGAGLWHLWGLRCASNMSGCSQNCLGLCVSHTLFLTLLLLSLCFVHQSQQDLCC